MYDYGRVVEEGCAENKLPDGNLRGLLSIFWYSSNK
jgi:hypothetical protein